MAPSRGLTAGSIAELVGGQLTGNPAVAIAGVAPLDRARSGDLAFIASARWLPHLATCRASAIIVAESLRDRVQTGAARIVVREPYRALADLLPILHPPAPPQWGIDATATVGPGVRWSGRVSVGRHAVIGPDAQVGARCVIADGAIIGAGVRLGDDCRIGTGSVVAPGTVVGSRVTLHPGAKIGTTGYGYVPDDPAHTAIAHVGRLQVGDDVDIGANTTIDRGTLADTTIGDGTKIDNLVQIAHNCRIGRRCLIMAQVGLAGSTVLEDNVILAGQAGLAGHLRVGEGARVAAQAGVIGDVPPGATISGYPARDHRRVLRQAAALNRLQPLARRLEDMVRGHAPPTP